MKTAVVVGRNELLKTQPQAKWVQVQTLQTKCWDNAPQLMLSYCWWSQTLAWRCAYHWRMRQNTTAISSSKLRLQTTTSKLSSTCVLSDYITLHTFLTAPFSGTTQVSQYQRGKISLDFTEARDSEWQWHQLGHMQVCTLLQTDNHARTPPLRFLQAGCPSCRPTNSIKAPKELH